MIPVKAREDLIAVSPCNELRRAFCIHRLKAANTMGFTESCTGPGNVLRGCPMMQQASGCFNPEPCQDFLKTSSLNANGGEWKEGDGAKFIKQSSCEHHPDRFTPPKAKSKRKSTPTPANNPPVAFATPQPVDTWQTIDDENQ